MIPLGAWILTRVANLYNGCMWPIGTIVKITGLNKQEYEYWDYLYQQEKLEDTHPMFVRAELI